MISLEDILGNSAISAIVCSLCILIFSAVAREFGFVDKPAGRKVHSGDVPLVGGLSIFFAVAVTSVGFESLEYKHPFLLMGLVLVSLGAFDDKYNLSAAIRFPIQASVSLFMIIFGGMSIESVGNIFGDGDVVLVGWVSIAFTIMCTVGVINSINMIDGIDGLSGSIILITLLPLLYLSWIAGEFDAVLLVSSFIAALVAFLYFNSRFLRNKALVFMGDAGSMLFGLFIVWLLITLSQGAGAVLSPVAAGWIFGLPLVDTMSVMVKRISQRRSPFDADRNHLHHRLLDAGFSVNESVAFMAFFHSLFIFIGLICNAIQLYEVVFFWSFVVVVVTYYFLGGLIFKRAENRRGLVE